MINHSLFLEMHMKLPIKTKDYKAIYEKRNTPNRFTLKLGMRRNINNKIFLSGIFIEYKIILTQERHSLSSV